MLLPRQSIRSSKSPWQSSCFFFASMHRNWVVVLKALSSRTRLQRIGDEKPISLTRARKWRREWGEGLKRSTRRSAAAQIRDCDWLWREKALDSFFNTLFEGWKKSRMNTMSTGWLIQSGECSIFGCCCSHAACGSSAPRVRRLANREGSLSIIMNPLGQSHKTT